MDKLVILLLLSVGGIAAWAPGDSQPHIIYLLADDLGFNDVSWKNEDVLTPNMAALVEKGVLLDRFYVQPSCSPSRSALLTGLYPIHNGFYEGALGWKVKKGLELQYKTIAEELNQHNYVSHMLGKWHLGWCNNDILPPSRGFSSFTGILHSGADHYTYETEDPGAYDLWNNFELDTSHAGNYSSTLYSNLAVDIIESHDSSSPLFLYVAFQNIHTPLQVPDEYLDLYPGTPSALGVSGTRKKAMAMTSAVDDAVQNIVDSLEDAGMLDNSIIIFSSDNGGQPSAGGANNLPLRGAKNTYWEGGMRVPSFVYSPLFDSSLANTTSDCTFHITDWFTTILGFANASATNSVDGMDQWDAIKGNSCPRTDLVHNIILDDNGDMYSGVYRMNQYKLIWGYTGTLNGYYYPNNTVVELDDDSTYYLFDIINDESESTNLADDSDYADVLATMIEALESASDGIVDFNTNGRCTEAEAVQDGNWVLGCCSSTNFDFS